MIIFPQLSFLYLHLWRIFLIKTFLRNILYIYLDFEDGLAAESVSMVKCDSVQAFMI